MNWSDPIRKAGKVLLGASLAVGLCPGIDAQAETRRPYYQQCPPGYRQPAPSYPYYTPSQPGMPSQPGQPGQAPTAPSPSDLQQPPRPDQTPDQTQTDQRPTDQQTQTPQDQAQQPSDFTPSPEASSQASLSPGMNTPQLGRLDQANRLNLFDNMVAAPLNRVWFGFQYSSGITTGLGVSDSFFTFFSGLTPAEQAAYNTFFDPFRAEQKQINYRVGAEVLLTCDASIAFQAQYFTNETDGNFGDDWSNPQIMAKYVLARDCDTILTATLGLTPQTSIDAGDFDENTTKIYPGMLYYETIDRNWFTQGGFQFGIPVRDDQISTFDWSLSLGYWLYRDCSLNSCHCCCSSGMVTGIIPQINLLGKHTVGDDNRNNAFGFDTFQFVDPDGFGPVPSFTGPLAVYTEPQSVLDLSIGTLIMVGCDMQIGVGYSFPITGDSTRENEFLSYVNYLF
jgi:hypothetical protein